MEKNSSLFAEIELGAEAIKAKLVFDSIDTDCDGSLNSSEMQNYKNKVDEFDGSTDGKYTQESKKQFNDKIINDADISTAEMLKISDENEDMILQILDEPAEKIISDNDGKTIVETTLIDDNGKITTRIGTKNEDGSVEYFPGEKSQVHTEIAEGLVYDGTVYAMEKNDDKVTITDPLTSKTYDIDLDKITSEIPEDKKEEFKEILSSLPAEALIDISIDAHFVEKMLDENGEIMFPQMEGYNFYWAGNDKIQTYGHITCIMHETGHSLDNLALQSNITDDNDELQRLMELGQKRYEEQGGAISKHDWGGEILAMSGGDGPSSKCELFAEAYKMAMIGYMSPDDTNYINDWAPYYKEAIDYCINTLLPQIRSKTIEERTVIK